LPEGKVLRHRKVPAEEAFRIFHERYFARLYQFLLSVRRGNEAEAQEAMQNTLLRVVRYARRFEGRRFSGAG